MTKKTISKKDTLAFAALAVAGAWVIIQVLLMIIAWDHPQSPDAVEYTSRALFAYDHHVLYPSVHNLYDRFTHAPGVVNFFLCLYMLFGTFKSIMIVNLLMNIAILYEVYYIAKFFFSRKVGYIAVILYSAIISFWFVPLHYLSDHPSYFLFITGFCLSLQRKWYWVVLAGVCYALSYTIRPTVLAYLVSSVIYMVVSRRHFRYYLYLLIPYFGILYGIGKYFEREIGIYTNTSHIAGYGMMHSANEKTWAGPDMSFSGDPNNSGYIENASSLTFAEKDSIWKSRAVKWVMQNPGRYIMLAPQRFFRSFTLDYWSLQDVFEANQYENAINSPHPEKALRALRMKQFLVSIPYYLMLVLFGISLYIGRKSLFTKQGLVLLITLFYTGTTFFFVAEHRGHYAFLFPMIIWAAYGISRMIKSPPAACAASRD